MWVCDVCGERFAEPIVRHYREDMNGEGAWEDFYISLCPYCGSDEVWGESDLNDDDDLFAPEPEWVEARRELESLHD